MGTSTNTKASSAELERIAAALRVAILEMGRCAGGGHLAPALSCADIVAALYFRVLHLDPRNPALPARDRFILSAGHKAAVQYAALALAGFFPRAWLDTYLQPGSPLAGHPDATRVPGVEVSTGSLGHGFPVGAGMALAARLRGEGFRTFVLLGDGELQEGSVWEAAMSAAHYRLDNLVAIVDYNGLNTDGTNAEVLGLEPLDAKWRAFGWATHAVDGHDMAALVRLFEAPPEAGKPTAVLARTVKGRGVPAMEGRPEWHTGLPAPGDLEPALAVLAVLGARAGRDGSGEVEGRQ